MKALEDITVLACEQFEAGTTATEPMAFMGATVIMVEPPGIGQPGRASGLISREGVDTFYHIWLNMNKKSITLNLHSPKGVEIFKEMVCSANQISRGQRIEMADLKLEERDVALLPNQYYSDLVQVISSEAKTIIPKNSTIFGWMIKEIPMIRRGAQVRLVVKADNLLVKAQGVALEDGYLNKEVKVKRSESNKILIGLVSSPGEVEVNLK